MLPDDLPEAVDSAVLTRDEYAEAFAIHLRSSLHWMVVTYCQRHGCGYDTVADRLELSVKELKAELLTGNPTLRFIGALCWACGTRPHLELN